MNAIGDLNHEPTGHDEAFSGSLSTLLDQIGDDIDARLGGGELDRRLEQIKARADGYPVREASLGEPMLAANADPVVLTGAAEEAVSGAQHHGSGVRMVGRDRERRMITGLLQRGGKEVVLIEGVAGIGKTRLVKAVETDAAAAGVPVLREISQPLGDGTHRVLLILDDPPWPRRRIESEVEAATRSGRVLLVLTRREPEPAERYPMGMSQILRLPLRPLSPAAVGELLEELLGAPADEELRALAGVAAGVPGAVVELVRGLREERLVVVEGQRAVLRARRLPGRAQARVDQQVRLLSGSARHLLRVASTLGGEFRVDELAGLLGEPPAALAPAIDETLAVGLLTGGAETLAFGHELVRVAVMETTPRPVLHALRRKSDVLPPAFAETTLEAVAGWEDLSQRELLIARLAAAAMTNQQIAHRIERSPHTVNYHLRQIYRKLGITSRVELAARLRSENAASAQPTAGVDAAEGPVGAP